MLEAVLSRRQLQQVMVNFWFNHFNVFAGDGLDRVWIGNYEDKAIRPYALGRFRDLLFAVAKHPAMLVYLDNTRNVARGLNENYAREVMELHTLGVDGGYTQNDVTTLARVFTGWRVNPPNSAAISGRRRGVRGLSPRLRAQGVSRAPARRPGQGRGRRGARDAGREPGDGSPYQL